jgi:plastocyanin
MTLARACRSLLPALALLLVFSAAPASAEVKTETFRMPVEVDGYQVKQQYTFGVDHPKVDGFITGMSVNVVDADGTPVPINRLMLHHIVFSTLGRPSPTCSQFTSFDSKTKLPGLAEQFYGAGEERNVLALPPGYGYPLKSNDSWVMVWMLMNHRQAPDHAFIQWTVTYDTSPNLTPVKPYWLDVQNCKADPIYSVPGTGGPGSVDKRTYTLTMPESGRIVAGGGHVHGGGLNLTLSEPDCANRNIATLTPAWGEPDHPFYHVYPILHEPGPIAMSSFGSEKGIPVLRGQRIQLTSNYDDSRLHTRVMGISLIYVAPDASVTNGCAPLPDDLQTYQTSLPHRTITPVFRVPITGIGPGGVARTISKPPGRFANLGSAATVNVADYQFSRRNIVLRQGSKLRWDFLPNTLHNVTVANGPQGFASENLSDGRVYQHRFTKPGTYQLFCALHPVAMTEVVKVVKAKKHA